MEFKKKTVSSRQLPRYVRGTGPGPSRYKARIFWVVTVCCLVASTVVVVIRRKNHVVPVQTITSTPQPSPTSTSYYQATPAPAPDALDASFERQVNDCLIPVASLYGYDLYINSGFRSATEQDALYAQGRTQRGP